MPSLDQIAAIFTIVAGSLALIQLTAILIRLNRRPRLSVRIGAVREVTESGNRVAVLQLITANSGSLSASNILWNYDLPATFQVLGPDAVRHERGDRVTVARALEHLHPRVETYHELTVAVPADVSDFELRYRIHLKDSLPQTGSFVVKLNLGAATEPKGWRAGS